MNRTVQISKTVRWSVTCVACFVAATASSVALGQTTYTVDDTQSYLNIAISASGYTFPQQFAGSKTLTFGGTVDATLSGGNVTFASTTDLDAIVQGTYLSPDVNGVSGTAPGDAGAKILALGIFNIGSMALRDIEATLTSSATAVNGSDEFNADAVTLGLINSSALDYLIGSPFNINGREALSGESALNDTGSVGTITADDLYLPVNVALQFDASGTTVDVTLTGEIVASTLRSFQSVPEPGTYVLLVVGLVGLFPFASRRLRSRR